MLVIDDNPGALANAKRAFKGKEAYNFRYAENYVDALAALPGSDLVISDLMFPYGPKNQEMEGRDGLLERIEKGLNDKRAYLERIRRESGAQVKDPRQELNVLSVSLYRALNNPPIPMSIEGRQGLMSLIASKDRGPWCFKASLEDFEGFFKVL